jgi:hypothetical protein
MPSNNSMQTDRSKLISVVRRRRKLRPITRPAVIAGVAVLVLTACAITQTANPVAGIRNSGIEACITDKADVRAVFQQELIAALERRGITTRVLPENSLVSSCPVSLTYNARWSWDFKPYMAWAEIVVYRDNARMGDALYSAPRGGWALTTRIYEFTESKVDTMVEQLFPAT